MFVEEHCDVLAEGEALAGADGARGETQLRDSVGGGDAVDQVLLTEVVVLGEADVVSIGEGGLVERGEPKEVADGRGDSVGPEAVEVDETKEVGGLRGESVVGRVGGCGVVLSLERVTKEDDKLEEGVGLDGEVDVTSGELVNLVDNEDGGLLEEGGFPGAEFPAEVGGEGEVSLPFVAQLSGWAADAEGGEGAGAEEMLDGKGFAAAGEAGDVNELHSLWDCGVDEAVKSQDFIPGGLAGGVSDVGVNGGKDAVEAILHIGDEVFGSG